MTLLDLVDALTLPRTENVRQAEDDGTYLRTVPVTHKPLLVQFAEAVAPSGNTSSGGGGLASQRNPIDSTALFEYSKIASAIGDWCRMIGVCPTRDACTDLRAWYAATLAYDLAEDFYAAQMRSWRGLILRHLDPPKQRQIQYACPICAKDSYWDPEREEGGRWPLTLDYRIEPRTVDGATVDCVIPKQVMCRACSVVWAGAESVNELLEELDEKESVA